MEYGAEDRELGERLMHRGVRPIQIRHRVDLHSPRSLRGYVNDAAWKRNREIWKETIKQKNLTDFGITQKS